MMKNIIIPILAAMLVISLAACGNTTPEPTFVPEESFKTMVSGTLTAVAYEVAQTQNAVPTVTPTELPTVTLAPTFTATREVVKITVTQDVNCRKGPSKDYPVLSYYPAGTEVEVLGKDPSNQYYYVRGFESAGSGCWVFGEYVAFTGDTAMLPVFTPQPTALPTRTPTLPPFPNFSVAFVGLTSCGGGNFGMNFKLTNTGTVTMDSIRIRNKVAGIDDPFKHVSNYFTQWSAGAQYLKSDELLPGEEGIVSTCNPGDITLDPTGKKVETAIYICTKEDLAGNCTTVNLVSTP